jgi:carboxyl-terminal processing protease
MWKSAGSPAFCWLTAILLAVSVSACSLLKETPSPRAGDLGVSREILDIIARDYVEPGKVDSTILDRGAARGILEALNDPYSTYLKPEEYSLTISQQAGSFGGIGATVGIRDNQVIVTAPIAGTPAAAAGIRAGDAILGVNGESTEGLGIEEVVLRIRGPEGTPVKVTIQHQGEPNRVELEIIRAKIDVPSISTEMREGVAYIRIHYFSERTDAELSPALKTLLLESPSGVVVDLRSNPGGPVDTVVDVAGHFLRTGVVLYIVDNKGNEVSYPVKRATVATDLPLVILTDNFSASGSEVLSGAIQDHRRGVVAGATTFGKGSADRWYELSDGSALYLTTSRWLTPNRRLIEGKGITPDFAMDLTGDDLVRWAIDHVKGMR